MRGIKTLIAIATLVAGLAFSSAAQAQINIQIGVQPTCAYGYYGDAPYGCAPRGYYGSGYFHNGIFLGMGPWAGWGYGHGWGSYRFVRDGGGNYRGRGGYDAGRGHWATGRDDREPGFRGNNDRRGNVRRDEGRPNQGRPDDHKGGGGDRREGGEEKHHDGDGHQK
jgi:hypothetical protein